MPRSRPDPAVRLAEAAADPQWELERLLALLAQLAAALGRNDRAAIDRLLRSGAATHLPDEVRDELHALARQSPRGFRAPIQFLRFRHRMAQLAHGGEGLPRPQLELPLGAGSGVPAEDATAGQEAADDAA